MRLKSGLASICTRLRGYEVALLVACAFTQYAAAEDPCFTSAQLIKKAVTLGEGVDAEVELYKEAERLCPKMAEAPFNLGLAYQKREDLEGAERELRKAVALKDEDLFRVGLAGVLLQRGEVAAAREQYDAALERNPKSIPAQQGIAVILEKQQKLPEAIEVLEKAGQIDPTNVVTFFNLGVLTEKLNRLETALAAYKRAADNDPKHPQALFALASMQARLGYLHDARRSYQRAAEINPDDARVQVGLAEVYEKLGDHAQAESALRRVVALAPQNVLARVNLGILLNESRKFQEASVILRKVSQEDGGNARIWSALGRAQLELGDTSAAETSLRRSLSLDDTNPYAHNNLGVLLQRQGKRREARKEFEVALQLRPEMEIARQNLEAVGGTVAE